MLQTTDTETSKIGQVRFLIMTRVLPEVTVYTGPMGAGKTTRLYGKMGELTHLGIPYEAYRPGVDVRDVMIAPRGYVVSANAALTPNCTTVESLADIPVEELVLRGIRTIFLEEWFMFGFDQQRRPISGLYREIMGQWALAGIERVYAAGLDQGASGNQFGLVVDARRYGAKVVVCTARCEYPVNGECDPKCGRIARNSQIYDVRDNKAFDMETLPDLLPEGLRPHDRYRAVCTEHLLLPAELTKPFDPMQT
jgi:thymidine kinase